MYRYSDADLRNIEPIQNEKIMVTTARHSETSTPTPARQYHRVKDAARRLGVPPWTTTWLSTSRTCAGAWAR